MIALFRKIRKSFIDSCRLTRYTVYTIGETALVIVIQQHSGYSKRELEMGLFNFHYVLIANLKILQVLRGRSLLFERGNKRAIQLLQNE